MTGPRGSRLVVAVSVVMVMVFTAAVAVGASPSAVDKAGGEGFEEQAVVVGSSGATPVVYVATGENFPDALGAGPLAGITDGPILLVQKDAIPVETQTELTRLNAERIVIVGGTGVVSAAVETGLGAFAGTVERLWGANRYATAAAVSAANFPAAHQFAVYDHSGGTDAMSTSCSNYTGAVLPITVPGPGTIVVEANVNIRVSHVPQAPYSQFSLFIGTSLTDCASQHGVGGDTTFIAMTTEPTGLYYPWVTMKKFLQVTGPGTTTFYITGREVAGTDDASFYFSFMDATFIPDPGT